MRITRIAVVGAAASMAFATAAPAMAHEASTSTNPTASDAQWNLDGSTLDQQKAWLDSYLTASQQRLTALAARIAADPHLTDALRSEWASKIARQQAALTSLKQAVDTATTESALGDALRSALAADAIHGMWGWRALFAAGYRLTCDEHNWDAARARMVAAKRDELARQHSADLATQRDDLAKQRDELAMASNEDQSTQRADAGATEHAAHPAAVRPAAGSHHVVVHSARWSDTSQSDNSQQRSRGSSASHRAAGEHGAEHHSRGHRHR